MCHAICKQPIKVRQLLLLVCHRLQLSMGKSVRPIGGGWPEMLSLLTQPIASSAYKDVFGDSRAVKGM